VNPCRLLPDCCSLYLVPPHLACQAFHLTESLGDCRLSLPFARSECRFLSTCFLLACASLLELASFPSCVTEPSLLSRLPPVHRASRKMVCVPFFCYCVPFPFHVSFFGRSVYRFRLCFCARLSLVLHAAPCRRHASRVPTRPLYGLSRVALRAISLSGCPHSPCPSRLVWILSPGVCCFPRTCDTKVILRDLTRHLTFLPPSFAIFSLSRCPFRPQGRVPIISPTRPFVVVACPVVLFCYFPPPVNFSLASPVTLPQSFSIVLLIVRFDDEPLPLPPCRYPRSFPSSYSGTVTFLLVLRALPSALFLVPTIVLLYSCGGPQLLGLGPSSFLFSFDPPTLNPSRCFPPFPCSSPPPLVCTRVPVLALIPFTVTVVRTPPPFHVERPDWAMVLCFSGGDQVSPLRHVTTAFCLSRFHCHCVPPFSSPGRNPCLLE